MRAHFMHWKIKHLDHLCLRERRDQGRKHRRRVLLKLAIKSFLAYNVLVNQRRACSESFGLRKNYRVKEQVLKCLNDSAIYEKQKRLADLYRVKCLKESSMQGLKIFMAIKLKLLAARSRLNNELKRTVLKLVAGSAQISRVPCVLVPLVN